MSKGISARGWRGIVRSLLAPAIALGLIAWALLEAHALLPVSGAPTTAAPLVAAVMPSEDLHTTSNGYLLTLTINAKSCTNPVHVFAQLVLPTEYYRAEDQWANSTGNPLTKTLVGLAVDNFHTDFQSMRESDWHRDPQVLSDRTWVVRFSNSVLVAATGAADVIRLDDWREHPSEIDAWFTADWLSPRGYGSCWLRLPSLMGSEVPLLGDHAADAVNGAIGPSAKLSNPGQSSSASGTYVFYGADGKKTVIHQEGHEATSYVGSVPDSIGYTILSSPMAIVPGETEGAEPTIGTPTWSCVAPKSSSPATLSVDGLEPGGALLYLDPPSLSQFTTSPRSDCASVIALADAGAQSRQNLLLLLIGAALSTGVALLIEVLVRQPRKHKSSSLARARASDADEPSLPPAERAHDDEPA